MIRQSVGRGVAGNPTPCLNPIVNQLYPIHVTGGRVVKQSAWETEGPRFDPTLVRKFSVSK